MGERRAGLDPPGTAHAHRARPARAGRHRVRRGGPERTVYPVTPDGETEFFHLLRLAITDPAAASELAVDGATVRIRVPDGTSTLPGLLRELDTAGAPTTSVEVRRPSLDDVFLTLTGRTLRDAEETAPERIAGGAR